MKKSTRLLIAGLMAISVTGASTLAYFTSGVSLGTGSTGDSQKELSIENGKVEISAEIGGEENAANFWYYDVARVSTDETNNGLDSTAKTTLYKWMNTDATSAIDEATLNTIDTTSSPATLKDAVGLANTTYYVKKNLSPDILGVGVATEPRGARANVYDKVTGEITKARPGDAFVLGYVASDEGNATANEGLTITNTSTIKTKVRVSASSNDAGKEISKLTKSGWKIYSKVSEGAWKEITVSGTDGAYVVNNLPEVTLGNDQTSIYIRIELPLSTGNAYNSGSGGFVSGNDKVDSFDVSKLFSITATQENNPGWKEDGSN